MPAPKGDHQLTVVELGDEPSAWTAAGFTVVDDVVRLGRTAVHLTGLGGWFRGWRLDGVDTTIDGLPTTSPDSARGSTDGPEASHPNGCTTIDHVVILTGDNDRTIGSFEQAGLDVRGNRITETYGFPARQTFFWAGEVIVELIGPETDELRNDNPVRVFGLALVARDLDETKQWFGDRMGLVKDAVQSGRRIGTVRHKEFGISLPARDHESPHLSPLTCPRSPAQRSPAQG